MIGPDSQDRMNYPTKYELLSPFTDSSFVHPALHANDPVADVTAHSDLLVTSSNPKGERKNLVQDAPS